MNGEGRPQGRVYRLVAVATAAFLLVGGSGADGGKTKAPTTGPVTFPGADGVSVGMRARAGDQVLFGATTVVNNDDTEAHLVEAYLIGDVDSDEASVSDVRVVDLGKAPGRGDLLGASLWPNDGWEDWWKKAEPIDSAILAPGDAAEVIFVIDVKETGEWLWPETALDYTVNRNAYTALARFGHQVCPPEPAECSDPLAS